MCLVAQRKGMVIKMKTSFKASKRGIAAILTLCILLSFGVTCVYAASVLPEENTVAAERTAQELVPVMTRGCSYPTLDQYLYQNASIYGFSVNDIKYGHDIQLSNGYYYHAGQYGSKLQCFIYNSSGDCVAFSTLSSM